MNNFEDGLKYFSGFECQVGIGLVTQTQAIVWADLDFCQAELTKTLFTGWELKDYNLSEFESYINQNFEQNTIIALNFSLIDSYLYNTIHRLTLMKKTIIDDKSNIVEICLRNNVKMNIGQVMILGKEYTKYTPEQKFEFIHEKIENSLQDNPLFQKFYDETKKFFAYRYVINHLDDLSWLINLRSTGNCLTPYIYGYGVLYFEKRRLYLKIFVYQKAKYFGHKVLNYLNKNNIHIEDYMNLYNEFKEGSASYRYLTLIDNEFNNLRLVNFIKENNPNLIIFLPNNPIEILKSIKNENEIQNIRNAAIKESIVYNTFQAWISNEISTKKNKIFLLNALIQKYKSIKADMSLFQGECTPTLILNGKKSSIVLPSGKFPNNEKIDFNEINLLNTNSQYIGGTTEITRTFHYGKPTAEMKENYTRILLGIIDFEKLKFSNYTYTYDSLDPILRYHLNCIGYDYPHLSCHGIGSFLNLREGPDGEVSAGNVFIAEPGYYKTNEYVEVS